MVLSEIIILSRAAANECVAGPLRAVRERYWFLLEALRQEALNRFLLFHYYGIFTK